MSEIAGLVAMSHSPFAHLLPPRTPDHPGGHFLANAARVADAVVRLAPDAVVVIGPDHFHGNFYDVMPPFVLGVEEAVGFGDFGSRSGRLPVATQLAWSIRDALAPEFDLSLSYSLTVDHGIVQNYDMTSPAVPLVPLVVNTAAPPLPSPARCVQLGAALGAAIRASAFDGRVLLIASGGLSHWLPSNDPRDPSVNQTRRESVIHGRKDTRAFSAAREPLVRAMGGNPDARVNAQWDRWFLKQLTADPAVAAALTHEAIEENAGTGGNEIRTWLIGQAAVARPFVWTSYEPVPEWITGMGIGATFQVD